MMRCIQWMCTIYLVIVITKGNESKSLTYLEDQRVNTQNLMYKGISNAIIGESKICDEFRNFLNSLSEITIANTNTRDIEIPWTLSMLDSWGKVPSGLLTGNLNEYGQFDECLAIKDQFNETNFKGKYCTGGLTLNLFLSISLAVCIPDVCDLAAINTELITINPNNCQTNDTYSELDSDDIIVIVIFSIILALMTMCTCYDIFIQYTNKSAKSPLFISFSLLTNGKKLFATSSSSGQVECLNGIRTISLMWIVAGHTFATQVMIPKINFSEVFVFQDSLKSSYISGANSAVDTFFFLAAFLVSYNYFKTLKSNISKAKTNNSFFVVENPLKLSNLPKFYIHRILRIMPALAAFYAFDMTLMRHVVQGPITPIIGSLSNSCKEYWWSFFLFIQNYVNYDKMCLISTWYLSADMQMYILSPLLIIPMGELIIKGRRKLAYILAAIAICLCILIPMIVDLTREYNLPTENEYATHLRFSIYTIGILFGMIVIDCKDKKIRINHALNLVLWAISLGVMLTIVLTRHDTIIHPEQVKNTMFATFARPTWTIALCWIIFACQFGYGGPANWFLSKPIFQVMTRLSFSIYLLQAIVLTTFDIYAKTSNHFSEYELIYIWCGDFVFITVFSIIWVLAFESPVVIIEKVIFGTGKKVVTDNKTETQQA